MKRTTITGTLRVSRPFKPHRGRDQIAAMMKDMLLPPRFYPPKYYLVVEATPTARKQIINVGGSRLEPIAERMVGTVVTVSGFYTPWGNGIGGDMRRVRFEEVTQ